MCGVRLALGMAAILVLASAGMRGAAAADYGGGVLRGSSVYELGSPTYIRWGGAYVGGQAGFSQASADFSDSTKSLVAFVLRNLALEEEAVPSEWVVLGKSDQRALSFGGFVGWNSQWDDVVLGVE